VTSYRAEKADARAAKLDAPSSQRLLDDTDIGGRDTFFAWYFRGSGPRGIVSGANIQQRFIQRGATYATFFEDNHVADLLGCAPGDVEANLAGALSTDRGRLREALRGRSRRFLTRAKKHARADRLEAVQAAAVEALKDRPGPLQARARIVWKERFEASVRKQQATDAPDIGGWLEVRTFFTELRRRSELRALLWPVPSTREERSAFRERQIRAQMLASAARLGHAFIDLYMMTIQRLGSLDLRAQEEGDDERDASSVAGIEQYLDLLDEQRATPRASRSWSAFDELADIASHFDLILDVNAPDVRTQPLSETATELGRLLRQQQPVGGMSGQVNQTLVRQFRMPGYPLVLISTDLLQEGEDLHTFCSAVHHYGISWTPSSMEQRIGRIDRVRSHTDRRLSALSDTLRGDEKLQVFFPHLADTVEVLQVDRVLERMNVFLRLMHEGLSTAGTEERKIDIGKELVRGRRAIPQITTRLKTAFPVQASHLEAPARELASSADDAARIDARFRALAELALPGVDVTWESDAPKGVLYGTVHLASRCQPFTLRLRSLGERILIHCVSPVGRVGVEDSHDAIVASVAKHRVRIGALDTDDSDDEHATFDLTVEDDVLLGDDRSSDATRLAMMLRHVADAADNLEQRHLHDHDEALSAFREQLEEEARRGR
jgi:hypothetical protein